MDKTRSSFFFFHTKSMCILKSNICWLFFLWVSTLGDVKIVWKEVENITYMLQTYYTGVANRKQNRVTVRKCVWFRKKVNIF